MAMATRFLKTLKSATLSANVRVSKGVPAGGLSTSSRRVKVRLSANWVNVFSVPGKGVYLVKVMDGVCNALLKT